MTDNIRFTPVASSVQNTNTLSKPDDIRFTHIQSSNTTNPNVNPAATNLPIAPTISSGNPVAAAVAGLANTGASTIESGIDAALWLTDKLGLTDPVISQSAKTLANKELTAKLRSGVPGAPNDVFTKSAEQYPITEGAAKYGSGIALLAKTGLPSFTKVPGIANLAAQTGANAVLGAGMAGPDETTQNVGALTGAVLTPIGAAVAKGISAGARKLGLTKEIQDKVAAITSRIKSDNSLSVSERALKSEAGYTAGILSQSNANYKAIKDIPGTIDVIPIQNTASALLAKATSLSDKQKNMLQGIIEDSNNIQTMDDALRLKQNISSMQSEFQGKGISDAIMNQFKTIKDASIAAIQKKAKDAGLSDVLKTADEHYASHVSPLRDSGAIDRLNAFSQESKRLANTPGAPISKEYTDATARVFPKTISPQKVKEILSRMGTDGNELMQDKFVQETFKDVMANPATFSKNDALLKINNTIDKYGDVLAPQTIDSLKGIKHLLQEAGAVAEKEGMKSDSYFLHTIGALVGGSAGFAVGGGIGSGIGVAAGIGLAPKVIGGIGNYAKGLVDTPQGQELLRSIGKNPQTAKKVIQTLIQSGPAILSDKTGE